MTANLDNLAAKVPEVAEWQKRLPPPDPALSPWLGGDERAVGRWCDYQGACVALIAVADYVARLEAERDALKCCYLCAHYGEGFCLWCATPSNGLATPVHPRSTKCRCEPDRWSAP